LSAGVGEGAQRATAAVTVAAQGQRRSSRSWVRRPDRVRRPAMASRHSVLGSATRSGPDNDSVWVQVSRVVGEENDGQPDRVRCRVVKRQVGQASVFGAADAVFGAGAAAVPQFRSGVARRWCWWEAGDPPPVTFDRPQLRAGVRHFAAGDDAGARRPSGQVQPARSARPRRRRRAVRRRRRRPGSTPSPGAGSGRRRALSSFLCNALLVWV
jgi:hypothetical protein